MNDDMLVGWDEIAAHLRVTVMTAIKYRKEGGMPVMQLFTGKVRASKKEIDTWLSLQGRDMSTIRKYNPL